MIVNDGQNKKHNRHTAEYKNGSLASISISFWHKIIIYLSVRRFRTIDNVDNVKRKDDDDFIIIYCIMMSICQAKVQFH